MNLLATLKQALFQWKSDGSAPLRLGQRRIFIIPSRGGLLFAGALIVMLIAAINYALALGHALVFLLAGLGLIGMVHTFRNLHRLIITPGRCDPVFAGEAAYFSLTLTNERAAPRLALEFFADGVTTAVAAIAPHETITVGILIPTRQRGWHALPRTRLSTHYPLGLFYAWCYLQPEMRCLVYPAPLHTPLPRPSTLQAGGHSGAGGGQEDFAGFRDHQTTDSLRHVAWKASARDTANRPLLIKEFDGGTAQELQLAWSLTDPRCDVDTRLRILCGWILTAEANHEDYGLTLPGLSIAPSHGSNHRDRCLKAIALYAA